jgi:hypothetical protein
MPGLIGLFVGRGFGLLVITGLVTGRLIGFAPGLTGIGLLVLIGIVVGRLTGLTPTLGLVVFFGPSLSGRYLLSVIFIPGMLLTLLG